VAASRGTFEVRGKTALVTGGARRIGRATALSLASAGVNVVVHYRRSEAEAADVARAVDGAGVGAWTVGADLASAGGAESLFDRAVKLAGPIDILVNNASVYPQDELTTVGREAVTETVAVHAMAPLVLSRSLAAQGRDGAIINFLGARVVDYDRGHASYHLGKRLLLSLTRMMALEFAPMVRVNAVAPGLILPPEGEDETYLERLASTNPLQGYGDLDAVTGAVLFLLRADFVTGQVLFVDGGRHLRGSVYG